MKNLFEYTNRFMREHLDFARANMMGPNVIRLSEELVTYIPDNNPGRILDLGCGAGLSSIFLQRHYNAAVFAGDLWITPTENHNRFEEFGAENIIPLAVDATKGLPFADEYFDILFSIDAYHYFGRTPEMLPSLIPYVKIGGYIAIALPAWKSGVAGVPPELKQYFANEEDAASFQTIDWWRNLWSKAEGIEIIDCFEMSCCKEAWEEWLASSHPVAVEDIGIMEAEQGKYFNFTALIAKRL